MAADPLVVGGVGAVPNAVLCCTVLCYQAVFMPALKHLDRSLLSTI